MYMLVTCIHVKQTCLCMHHLHISPGQNPHEKETTACMCIQENWTHVQDPSQNTLTLVSSLQLEPHISKTHTSVSTTAPPHSTTGHKHNDTICNARECIHCTWNINAEAMHTNHDTYIVCSTEVCVLQMCGSNYMYTALCTKCIQLLRLVQCTIHLLLCLKQIEDVLFRNHNPSPPLPSPPANPSVCPPWPSWSPQPHDSPLPPWVSGSSSSSDPCGWVHTHQDGAWPTLGCFYPWQLVWGW